MNFEPTEQQDKAIKSSGQILVSAAAGSGKTAVLVEKIVKMITTGEDPVPADRIMVVTFTNAAAAEFRSRIDARLQEVISENRNNTKLQKQAELLSNAYIGTTDSICLRLVRENFEVLGDSPSVKVVDSVEYHLMQYNILTDIFKECYSCENSELYSLLKLFPDDIDDRKTKDLLLKFYNTVANQISRENYLNEIHKMYELPNFMYWLNQYSEKFLNRLSNITKNLEAIKEKLEEDSKLIASIDEISVAVLKMSTALDGCDYKEIYDNANKAFKPKMPGVSKKVPSEVLSSVKANKKSFDAIKKELTKLYCYDVDTITESYNDCKNAVFAVVKIMQNFIERLDTALIEKGLISFELSQRLALSLLRKFEDGIEVIPDTAQYIIDKFDCVMVDEYQDTNNLQDYFFNAISNNSRNLFAVGDMKQSIYRFRGANPDNFKEKQQSFANYDDANETEPRKIFLQHNFRSRPEICDFVNYFFEGRMTDKVGSIEYSDNERLNHKAKYPQNDEYKTEVVLLNHQKILSRVELEAYYTAKFIKDSMKKEPFLIGENGSLRKAEYKDFAIFVRTDQGNIDVFARIFAQFNIPFSVAGNLPLLSSEVVTVISLLKVINNKNDDISLVSALLSPLFGFNLEEVAELKFMGKDCIFDALNALAKDNEKANRAYELITKFKTLSSSVSIGELIYSILNITSFKEIVLSMNNGKIRAGNLSILEELAFSFDKNDSYSLGAFLSYYEKIAENFNCEVKPDKNENTVKIMTMHKSKGLQYPICIVALNTKQFTDKESRQSFLASNDNGVGFKYINKDSKQITTPAFSFLLAEDRAAQLSEEMRVYYVALTRAEEKLMILISDDFEKKLSEDSFLISNYNVKSFSAWVLDAAFSSPCSNDVRKIFDLPTLEGSNDLFNLVYEHAGGNDEIIIEDDVVSNNNIEFNQDDYNEICNIFGYEYPYEYLKDVVAKTSVSSLVHKANTYTNSFNARPSFAQTGGLSSAQKGTALHKFMQYVDFEAGKIDLNAEIERLYESKFLSYEEAKSLNLAQIQAFLDSNLLCRALSSKKLYREYKFISEIPLNITNLEVRDELKNHNIIIQGAVDCMFIENNELVIIDFKTDKMENEDDFVKVYKEQLDYYSLACEKIFGISVKDRYIYSFHLGKTIKL